MVAVSSTYRLLRVIRGRDACRLYGKVKIVGIAAENQLHVAGRDEGAILANVVERLRIGAASLDIRHVGTPHELGRPGSLEGLADDGLRLGKWIFPAASIEN